MAGIYTPVPTNSAQPLDSDYVLMAAAELRTLKGYIATQLASLGGPLDTSLLRNKNYLRNGSFRVSQRGLQSITAGFNISADGWNVSNSGTGLSGTHNTSFNSNFSSGYCLSIEGSWTSGVTDIRQNIEAINAASLQQKTATFSVTVFHNLGAATDFTVQVYAANAVNNFTSLTSLGSTTTSVGSGLLVKLSVTVNCGLLALNGLSVRVSTPATTAVSKTILIGEAQLELGGYATDLETRSYAQELADCKRYYQKESNLIFSGNVTSGFTYFHTYTFPQEMRIAPAVTLTPGAGANGFPTTRTVQLVSANKAVISSPANASTSGAYYWYNIELSAEL